MLTSCATHLNNASKLTRANICVALIEKPYSVKINKVAVHKVKERNILYVYRVYMRHSWKGMHSNLSSGREECDKV